MAPVPYLLVKLHLHSRWSPVALDEPFGAATAFVFIEHSAAQSRVDENLRASMIRNPLIVAFEVVYRVRHVRGIEEYGEHMSDKGERV